MKSKRLKSLVAVCAMAAVLSVSAPRQSHAIAVGATLIGGVLAVGAVAIAIGQGIRGHYGETVWVGPRAYHPSSAGGAFWGAAGGYLALASSYIWVEGMIAGRGWIAIGLVIFARWQPKLALVGALLFGAIEALIPRVQATGADVPIYMLMMLPYLATLGVLILASLTSRRSSDEPGNLGVAYRRQDRH